MEVNASVVREILESIGPDGECRLAGAKIDGFHVDGDPEKVFDTVNVRFRSDGDDPRWLEVSSYKDGDDNIIVSVMKKVGDEVVTLTRSTKYVRFDKVGEEAHRLLDELDRITAEVPEDPDGEWQVSYLVWPPRSDRRRIVQRRFSSKADMDAFIRKLHDDKEFATSEQFSHVFSYGRYDDPEEQRARMEREAYASEQKYRNFRGGRNSY